MSARIDLTGRRFSAWTVLEFGGHTLGKQARWLCRCDCGTERNVAGATLRNGASISCGCVKRRAIAVSMTTHGHTRVRATGQRESRTYTTWSSMHNRCRGNTEGGRKYYVAYGVKVCERWNSFENFLTDMGEAPEGKSIDRWPDKYGDYEPGNCRWATPKEQAQNKRPYAYQGPGTRLRRHVAA